MIGFYLFAMLCSGTSVFSADNDFLKCDMKEWKKVGCFKDNINQQRALPQQLVNIRDPHSNVFQPPKLDWLRLSDSWLNLACHCAKKARDKGYKVFGLQFYGECWSGENGLETYKKFGIKDDKKCLMDFNYEEKKWVYCDMASDQPCVGVNSTNYIYILNEEPKSPESQSSDWGDWTECDKTCGTGKQVRERTCKNPSADPQGKACEGPGEETRSCKLKECPIHGGFAPWKPVQECTKTCGNGTQLFARTCTSPPPQHGGKDCSGPKEKTEPCNKQACPVPCTAAIDLAVLIDATNSVGDIDFRKAKAFALKLVNYSSVSPGATHLGLMVFNINGTILIRFNEQKKQNLPAIKAILDKITELKGYTFTDRALKVAGEVLFTEALGDRTNKPNVLIILTDGKTNWRSEPYETALEPLKKKNVTVVAVGVGPLAGDFSDELTKIAMGKKENVVQVTDFDSLYKKTKAIIDLSCGKKS